MKHDTVEVPRELWEAAQQAAQHIGQASSYVRVRLSAALAATKPGEGYWLAKDDPYFKAVDALVRHVQAHRIPCAVLISAIKTADPRRESVEKKCGAALSPYNALTCGLPRGHEDVHRRCPEPSPAPTVSADLPTKAWVLDRLLVAFERLASVEDPRLFGALRVEAKILQRELDHVLDGKDEASRHGLKVEGET
jgi:hypothetical protein